MDVQIVDNLRALQALVPEWHGLLSQAAFTTPFQLPAWLLTWWKHFGSGELRVFAVRDHGKLYGIVPCFLHSWNGRRQLTLIGSGISDYTDPPIFAEAIPALADHLASMPDWEVLDWQDLGADTPLRLITGLSARSDTNCSELSIAGSFEQFFASRGKELRRNCRRYGERARQLGTVSFEVSERAEPELLDALVNLHARRWQERGEAGMIAANHSEPFLREVATEFAAINILRIFSVRLNGRIMAILLAFDFRKRIFSYMSAFEPEHQELGFGRMLLFEAIRYAFANGYAGWNFLRGDEAYKLAWGATSIPKIRLYRAR